MDTQATRARLDRMTNEADVSAAPALWLLAASALLVLGLGLSALLAAPVDAQTATPQPDPPATAIAA